MRAEALFVRRLAGRVIDEVLRGLELDQVQLRLNVDDPRVMMPHPDGSLRLAEDWSAKGSGDGLARVYYPDDGVARVVIPRVDLLVRPQHRLELDLAALGIRRGAGRANDVDVTISLDSVLEPVDGGESLAAALYHAPQKPSALAGRQRRRAQVRRIHKRPVSQRHVWPDA